MNPFIIAIALGLGIVGIMVILILWDMIRPKEAEDNRPAWRREQEAAKRRGKP